MKEKASFIRRACILISLRRDNSSWTKTNCSTIKTKNKVLSCSVNFIEDKNFNLIMLSNAQIHILENFSKQYKHVFQIENENRKYILSTKSPYDLEQWVFAIQGQIRLSKDNKNIADVNQSITLIEKDIAQNDMHLITKIFKPKNVIFNPVQQILLDYVNDPFINELLPNLTNYMLLVREKEY